MSRTMQAVVCILLAAGLIWVSGCGGEKATNTPADALKKAGQAELVGDKDAYLASVKVSPGSSDYVDAKMEERREIRAFADATVKAYGAEDATVKRVVDAAGAHDLADGVEHADKLKYITTDNIGSATLPDGKTKVFFFLEEGVWKVDASKSMAERNLIGEAQKCRAGAAAFRKARGLIGKEGYTADKVMAALMAEMK